jgi:hypothetical protein
MTDYINVKDYGAVGNGTTDDSNAIQSAITAAPDGSIVLFPAPTVAYRITKQILVNKRLTLEGGKCKIKMTAGNGFSLFAENIVMRGFNFTGSRINWDHCAINIFMSQVKVEDIEVEHCSHAVRVLGGVWHTLSRIRAKNIVYGVLEVGNTVGAVVEDFRYDTDVANYPAPVYGVYYWGEGANFSDLDFIHAGKALWIESTANRSVNWTFFNSCSFDTSDYGCIIQGNAVGRTVDGLMFDQCWFASHKIAGVWIEGAKVNGITMDGCHIINNQKEGVILVGAATNIDFNGCVFGGNSAFNPGIHHNIYSNSSGRKFIRNCQFSDWGGFVTNVGYDILRAEQDGDCVIDGNISMGQTGGGYISGSSVQAKIGRNFGSLPSA